VKILYIQSGSIELGSLNTTILSIAFKQQSSKWPEMTQNYMSRFIVVVHRFMVTSLN
ncbi:hypothetical protein P152DRAFT_386731, partial [Eremomyces bilateralis CBS 781.70]